MSLWMRIKTPLYALVWRRKAQILGRRVRQAQKQERKLLLLDGNRLTLDADLPLVLHAVVGGQVGVLGAAREEAPVVRLGRHKAHAGRRHDPVRAHLTCGNGVLALITYFAYLCDI